MADAGERARTEQTPRREVNGGGGAPAGAAPGRADAPSAAVRTPARRGGRRLLVIGLVLLVLGAGAGSWWYLNRYAVSTDDAFIEANIAQLAPRVGGTVARVLFEDNAAVAAGQLLLEIDPRDYQVALDSAKANAEAAEARAAQAQADLDLTQITATAALSQADAQVAVAQAQLIKARADTVADQAEAERARADAERYLQLSRNNYASRQQFDQATAAAHSADAKVDADRAAENVANSQIRAAQAQHAAADTATQQVAVRAALLRAARGAADEARAAVHQAELNLGYTKVAAPVDGHVTARTVQPGDVVGANQALIRLIFGDPWVVANYKETQLTAMRPGQPVTFAVDAYPGATFKGHVDSVQRGTGARFSLLPPENATGNYVKVVQRVPVKLVFDEPPDRERLLAPGMSVVPTVDTTPAGGG